MHHAVTDRRRQFVAQLLLQPVDGLVECARHVGDRVAGHAVDQDFPVLALGAELRACPDAVDLPLQAPLQLVVLADVEELELDARAAGVEDEDGLGHRIRPRTGCVVRR